MTTKKAPSKKSITEHTVEEQQRLAAEKAGDVLEQPTAFDEPAERDVSGGDLTQLPPLQYASGTTPDGKPLVGIQMTEEEQKKLERELKLRPAHHDDEGSTGPIGQPTSQFDQDFVAAGALDEVENFFQSVPMSEDSQSVRAGIVQEAKDMAYVIVRHVPRGFARDNAMKSLKDSVMWATDALAKQDSVPQSL